MSFYAEENIFTNPVVLGVPPQSCSGGSDAAGRASRDATRRRCAPTPTARRRCACSTASTPPRRSTPPPAPPPRTTTTTATSRWSPSVSHVSGICFIRSCAPVGKVNNPEERTVRPIEYSKDCVLCIQWKLKHSNALSNQTWFCAGEKLALVQSTVLTVVVHECLSLCQTRPRRRRGGA